MGTGDGAVSLLMEDLVSLFHEGKELGIEVRAVEDDIFQWEVIVYMCVIFMDIYTPFYNDVRNLHEHFLDEIQAQFVHPAAHHIAVHIHPPLPYCS